MIFTFYNHGVSVSCGPTARHILLKLDVRLPLPHNYLRSRQRVYKTPPRQMTSRIRRCQLKVKSRHKSSENRLHHCCSVESPRTSHSSCAPHLRIFCLGKLARLAKMLEALLKLLQDGGIHMAESVELRCTLSEALISCHSTEWGA